MPKIIPVKHWLSLDTICSQRAGCSLLADSDMIQEQERKVAFAQWIHCSRSNVPENQGTTFDWLEESQVSSLAPRQTFDEAFTTEYSLRCIA